MAYTTIYTNYDGRKDVISRGSGTAPWDFLKDFRGKEFSGEWPTIAELYRITAKRFPNRPGMTIYDPERISLTYAETLVKVEAVARALYAAGIKHGDKVAVTGKNVPEWCISLLAANFAGATAIPIDYQLHDDEVERILNKAKPKILFVDEEKHDLYIKEQAKFNLDKVYSLKKGIGTYIYDLDGPAANIEPAKSDDLAMIMFTSGTTGTPKGVMLTNENFVADILLAQANLDIFETDVFYALLPIHHSYSLCANFGVAISMGCEIVFGKRMFVPQILKDLKTAKVTAFLGVPMLFNKLLAGILRGVKAKGPLVMGIISALMGVSGLIKKATGLNPGKKLFGAVLKQASLYTIRVCVCGGGPLAPSVFRKFNQLGIDFIQGYGLTETSPIINLNPIEHYKETSVGKTCARVDEKILDPDERGVGEVIIKGPMVMKGYYEMPEETAEVFTSDGYLKTGDLGYLDDENYLYLTGRAKNMIVTGGGKNVYPEELENEFQLFDEIDQIMIRGFAESKETRAEKIEALVYPSREFFEERITSDAAGVKSRIGEIISEVNTRLQPYQKIESLTIIEERLEETSTKKIKRNIVK